MCNNAVSTAGKGERFGEGSLPFGQFASRLYLFHDDGLGIGQSVPVPDSAIAEIEAMARESWAADRQPG